MAKVVINGRDVEEQIRKAVAKKMNVAIDATKPFMSKQAKIYSEKFANSEEFRAIKTWRRGEFGFTTEELAQLDRVLTLMIPGANNVTTISDTTTGTKRALVLNWIDYPKLKDHEFASHILTRITNTGGVEPGPKVSWIQWLEEGETFPGFRFVDPTIVGIKGELRKKLLAFSRSGEGLMLPRRGTGIFILEPTRIFEKIASEADIKILKDGFISAIRKLV